MSTNCLHLLPLATAALLALGISPAPCSAESLESAWQTALAVDQQVEATRWTSSAAARGLHAAQAERLPSVDATANYYAMSSPVGLQAALPGLGTLSLNALQNEGLMAGAHITQPVYTFGKIQAGIDAACSELNAAASAEAVAELEVLLRVSVEYTNVLLAQRAVEVSQQAVESLEAHAKDVKNLVEQGVRILNDQLAVEVALSNAKQQLLQANSLLDMAGAALNRSLGRPLDSPVDLDEVTEPDGSYDLDQLTQRALVQRPEIEALSHATLALRSRAQGVRAANKPQFMIRGGVDYLENRYFTNETFSSVMLMGQWNLFDSGRKRQTAAKLDETGEALLRKRNDVQSMIGLQVRNAWSELETTRARVRVNRDALKSADENLRVAKGRYDNGAGTNTEVLDAETLRTATYSNYYKSLYDSVQALMKLSRAVGDFSLALGDVQSVEPLPENSVVAPPTP